MKKTPLNQIHKNLKARMVEFAGWEMPVLYTGVIAEHHAVRQKAGIFDVSHMGEIEIVGSEAELVTQKLTCNDITRLKDGDCQYSAFLTEQGTFIDDIIVNKFSKDRFLICVNASNVDKDFEWAKKFETSSAKVLNRSDDYFQIALQGPEAENIMQKAAPKNLPPKYFTFVETELAGEKVILARTGYTGEKGFEIYGNPQSAEKIWTLLMELGATPCGLGARDTLRLEAALPLYGHEIDDTINPYEAGLSWIVKLNKGDFVGANALRAQQAVPLQKKLVGITMLEPGIARQGAKIFSDEKEVGWVTSGTKSPTLDRAIALGYITADARWGASGGESGFSPRLESQHPASPVQDKPKTKIRVDIHNKSRHAEITSLPFYKIKK